MNWRERSLGFDIVGLLVIIVLAWMVPGMLIDSPNRNNSASDSPMTNARNLPQGSTVQESTWTDGPWPFTEDAGSVVCTRASGQDAVYFVTSDERRWPLNGTASANANQFGAEPSLNPIWRENPNFPGTRVSVDLMIRHGRELCQRSGRPQRRHNIGPAAGDIYIICHDYIERRIVGMGVDTDFPMMRDMSTAATYLGGTAYVFRSHVDLIDGQDSTRLHYTCAVENGAVVDFQER